MTKLTHKQKQFCQEYLVDLNATQAAIRAGYSDKTARSLGSENLSKPNVQKHISLLMCERNNRTQINADWVLQAQKEVYEVAMALKPTKILVKTSNGDGSSEQIIKEFKKHDLSAANKALETIGKHVDVQAWHDKQTEVQINNTPTSVSIEFL